jgi:tetratricopeptide (TPR) repeat protein
MYVEPRPIMPDLLQESPMKIKSCSCAIRFTILLSVLALTASAFAQENSLEIKCFGPDGQSVSGIKVVASPIAAAKGKDKDTKCEKGVALFKKLDDGVYRVLGRQPGFAPAFAEFFALKGGTKLSGELHFQAGDPVTKVYFEDPALNQKAMQTLGDGIQLLQAGKFAEAEKPIQESLKINPSNPDGSYNLAIAFLQQRKFDEAVAPLKRTVDIAKALQQLPMAGAPPGAENPYAQRVQQAQFVLDKIPIFKLRVEGEKLAQERKFDEAIAKYNEALKTDPNDPDLYYNLSLAQANAKRYDEAMKAADKAIQLKPGERDYAELKKRITEIQDNEVVLKARGILEEGDKLYQAADYAGALKKYEEALPMVPQKNQPVVIAQMGRAYGRLKQGDKAVEYFKKAIEMAPDVADYRKALAQYYLTEKKYDEALNVYSDPRATGNQPPDQALFTVGMTLSKQGNSEVAELAFEKALKINPDNAEAGYELGMSLYSSGKNDKLAKEVLNKYLLIGKDAAHLENVKAVLVVVKKRTP